LCVKEEVSTTSRHSRFFFIWFLYSILETGKKGKFLFIIYKISRTSITFCGQGIYLLTMYGIKREKKI